MRDQLSITFQEPYGKAELLKLVYENRSKATKSGRPRPYSQTQICDYNGIHLNY